MTMSEGSQLHVPGEAQRASSSTGILACVFCPISAMLKTQRIPGATINQMVSSRFRYVLGPDFPQGGVVGRSRSTNFLRSSIEV